MPQGNINIKNSNVLLATVFEMTKLAVKIPVNMEYNSTFVRLLNIGIMYYCFSYLSFFTAVLSIV